MKSIVAFLLLASVALAGCADEAPSSGQTTSYFVPNDPRVPEESESHVDASGPRARNPDAPVPESLRLDPNWPFPVFGQPTMIAESTGREMSIAVDPNDPDRVLACAPTGTSVVGSGYSDLWLSSDGGATWTQLDPEPNTDARTFTDEGGDCDVAIGPDGILWFVDSWLGGLSLGRSADGVAWTGTALAAPVPIADRPWIQVDAEGVLHMTYQDLQFAMPSAIWYTRTTDGTLFSPPASVTTASDDGAFTWTGDFAVSDDGSELYSVYTRRTSTVIASPPDQVWLASSLDGGSTWTNTMISQRGGPASFLYPSLDRDSGGGLHVVFSEKRADDQPTFYTASGDGGATWSEPVALLEGGISGAPWVAAREPGHAMVLFSGTPDATTRLHEQDWYFYWARITPNAIQVATTTAEPLFTGPQNPFPEFNMIAIDGTGRAHIAAVAPWMDEEVEFAYWRPYHQVQVAGPAS